MIPIPRKHKENGACAPT